MQHEVAFTAKKFHNCGLPSCINRGFNMSDVSPNAFLIWNRGMKFGTCYLSDVVTPIASNVVLSERNVTCLLAQHLTNDAHGGP
jgi:hypothetical protein